MLGFGSHLNWIQQINLSYSVSSLKTDDANYISCISCLCDITVYSCPFFSHMTFFVNGGSWTVSEIYESYRIRHNP